MLTYRAHVYNLTMAASAEASSLALALSRCESALIVGSDRPSTLQAHLPDLRTQAASLRTAVEELMETLPPEVQSQAKESTDLYRHLNFTDYWLRKNLPERCTQDSIDIVSTDIPGVLDVFEKWYERRSPVDQILNDRLKPHLVNGQLNAASREVWAIFKTRMVKLFNLPPDIDGDKLAGKLFGGRSATTQLLEAKEREG